MTADVVVADVDHHIESPPAVRGDRLVQRGEQRHHPVLEVGSLAAGTQPDGRPVPKVSGIAVTMLDLPDRGVPFRPTI